LGADEPGLARGRDRLGQRELGGRVLLARVDERLRGSGRVRSDQDALELRVRVTLDQLLVDVRAGVALVEVDDHELAARAIRRFAVAHRLELDAGWEPGTPAAAQLAFLDLVDDLLRRHGLDGLLQRAIDAALACFRQIDDIASPIRRQVTQQYAG